MYRTIEQFDPNAIHECEEQVGKWLEIYQNQTQEALTYIPTLVQRVNRIKKV
ncbi:hypothetical protein D3C80_1754490 [compost metagenome]